MSTAFGHQSFIGIGEQVTFGAGVAPSIVAEFKSESLKLNQAIVKSPSLRSPSIGRKLKGKRSASGAVNFHGDYSGTLHLIFKHAFGAHAVGAPNVDGVRVHTYSLADKLPEAGLSLYVDRDSAAIGKAFRYIGAQVGKLTFAQAQDDFLAIAAEFEARDEERLAPLGQPGAGLPAFGAFNGIEWSEITKISIDGNPVNVQAEAFEFSLENAMATDRFTLLSRLRRGLGRNGARVVTGKIDLEFEDEADYARFDLLSEHALEIEYTGAIAAGASPFAARFTFPRVIFGGTTPNVTEAGPLKMSLPFDALATANGENDEVELQVDNLSA